MALSKEELEEQKETAKAVLLASYEMYDKSITDMLKRRNEAVDKDGNKIYSEKDTKKALKLMETMQQDVVDRFVALGYSEDEIRNSVKTKGKKKGIDRKALESIMIKETAKEEMAEFAEKMNKNKKNNDILDLDGNYMVDGKVKEDDNIETISEIPIINDKEVEIELPKIEDYGVNINNSVTNRVQYDVVPLPSKGQCYKNKLEKVPVSYLTAYDENLIVSPNLYKDGTFIDELLKSKIMNSKIDADDLLPGDRDAIILWLRGTSYGTDFPVTATDNASGKQFESVVDLTTIKPKEFKLVGDEDGYFDFKLPFSGDVVKFRFLSYKNLKALDKLEASQSLSIKKNKLNTIKDDLSEIVDNDKDCERSLKMKLTESIKNIDKYIETIDTESDRSFTQAITNKLIMSIISVNNITDRKYINDYVMYMNVKDSSALRRYITENEPGLDFNVDVERPESLGGGSVKMFLTLDQFIFLNIS